MILEMNLPNRKCLQCAEEMSTVIGEFLPFWGADLQVGLRVCGKVYKVQSLMDIRWIC